MLASADFERVLALSMGLALMTCAHHGPAAEASPASDATWRGDERIVNPAARRRAVAYAYAQAEVRDTVELLMRSEPTPSPYPLVAALDAIARALALLPQTDARAVSAMQRAAQALSDGPWDSPSHADQVRSALEYAVAGLRSSHRVPGGGVTRSALRVDTVEPMRPLPQQMAAVRGAVCTVANTVIVQGGGTPLPCMKTLAEAAGLGH